MEKNLFVDSLGVFNTIMMALSLLPLASSLFALALPPSLLVPSPSPLAYCDKTCSTSADCGGACNNCLCAGTCGLNFCCCEGSTRGSKGTLEKGKPIRVALYRGKGDSVRGQHNTQIVLDYEGSGIEVENVTADVIQNGLNRSKYDVVFFPGGGGRSQSNALGETGRENVRKFIAMGGGYIGVCAGAYLALGHSELNISGAYAEVTYHGKSSRGDGNASVTLTADGVTAFKPYNVSALQVQTQNLFYANGPTMKFTGAATRDSEAKALMNFSSDSVPIEKHYVGPTAGKGLLAVIHHRYSLIDYYSHHGISIPDNFDHTEAVANAGRVLLSGPHPETDQDDFEDRDGPPAAPTDVRAKILQAYVKLVAPR